MIIKDKRGFVITLYKADGSKFSFKDYIKKITHCQDLNYWCEYPADFENYIREAVVARTGRVCVSLKKTGNF